MAREMKSKEDNSTDERRQVSSEDRRTVASSEERKSETEAKRRKSGEAAVKKSEINNNTVKKSIMKSLMQFPRHEGN